MSRSGRKLKLLGVLSWLLAAGANADAGGKVQCEITENGAHASGVVSIQRDGKEVATGGCGRDLMLPEGNYTAALRLDGALDGPEQRRALVVRAGAVETLNADFVTGTLEVRIANAGRRAAGMAIIKRSGQQLATLGSGVAAHLSAGTYRVIVRYRMHEKDLGDVTVAAGQRVALDAAFE